MVDLSEVEVVDAHCHPYRIDDLLARDPTTFDTRILFLGTCFSSSSHLDPALWSFIDGLTDSTVFALAMRRWLAEHLGCEPTREAVARARDQALRADPVAYTRGLLGAEHVSAVLCDEGYPQPTIPREEFEAALGIDVHRVARLEPWILEHRGGSFDDLVSGVEAATQRAADDPRCVAYKSIIAYRTGLDVGDPPAAEASAAFRRWRDDAWAETRQHAKPVRDFLLRRALDVAKVNDRPFHIHCGGGDPDIELAHAQPKDLFPLLRDRQDQPIVLIHAGFPWVTEAAYLASILPHVYLDLSELIPWGWSQIEWAIEMLVGSVPAAKLLHGSDEASEPEMFWVSARVARRALEEVLDRFVARDDLSPADAVRIARGVLGDNARRLHGIA
jgi:predicted TIM-barrel fold metal-dependent hydrolase